MMHASKSLSHINPRSATPRMQARTFRPTPSSAATSRCNAALAPQLRASGGDPRPIVTARCSATEQDYEGQLSSCEEEGDWATTLELLAEVKVLKVQLPPAAIETSVRTLAVGGQWKRALTSLDTMMSGEHKIQAGTYHLHRPRKVTSALLCIPSLRNIRSSLLVGKYTVLATHLLNAGKMEEADQVLEYRDYM
eukprot:gene13475-19335_t